MSITRKQGIRWLLIPMLALLLLGATSQLRELSARDIREKAVTWILRAVYEFAASKFIVPGQTVQMEERKHATTCRPYTHTPTYRNANCIHPTLQRTL